MRLTSLLIVIAIVAGLAAPVFAEDKAKAAAAYRLGTQHYDLGEYDQALDAFKEAYRNFEDPAFLFNIAQCYRQRGDAPQAIRAYRMYLIKVPGAPNADDVRETVRKLEKTPPGQPPPPEAKGPPPSVENQVATPPPSVIVVPRARAKPPVYKRWWFWTTVAGVVVIGAGVGVGLSLYQPAAPKATTSYGSFQPF